VLNRGWFTESASRAMLVHTRTFGKYFGNEKLINSTGSYGVINNLELYTDVKEIRLKVVNSEGGPVSNASVQFCQLNYAEFYPLATVLTDISGECSFLSAAGDLLIWASSGDDFGFVKASVPLTDTISIILGESFPLNKTKNIDLLGPEVVRVNPVVADKLAAINKLRLRQEDSIRQNYISSWISIEEIAGFAKEHGFETDQISSILSRAMGNYKEILKFLQMAAPDTRLDAIALLNIVADKDLRDTRADVLFDHLLNARKFDISCYSEEIFLNYILNPRIANEIISPWRAYIQAQQNTETIESFRTDPTILAAWMNVKLPLRNELNYYKVPISPIGVLELGIADSQSRDILFVACCRSCGIPARLEPGTSFPQYYKNGLWQDIYFEDRGEILPRSASLKIVSALDRQDAQYYKHFTIARLDRGVFHTLAYDYNKKTSDFTQELLLSPGYYMLVTSNRLDDRKILSSIRFFELKKGETTLLDVSYRENQTELISVGRLSGDGLTDLEGKPIITESILGEGLILAWIDHEKEPSKHLLNEIQELESDFENWEGKIVFISDPEHISDSFDPGSYSKLPDNSMFAYDKNLIFLKSNIPDISLDISVLPVIVFVNANSDFLYKSEGYQLGYGEQLLKIIKSR
ncbi:MAG: hypothetical protein QNK33_03805, partial [Bacteroidales bacterium]|nr:hypothetical protein [Bacteroidales bacterium]